MLFKACLADSPYLSPTSSLPPLPSRTIVVRENVMTDLGSTHRPCNPPLPQPPHPNPLLSNHLAVLKCTLSVTRYKRPHPLYTPQPSLFGSIRRSLGVQSTECKKGAEKKRPRVRNFLCKCVFCLRREGKGYRQTKHEVEKI